jgi:hypothetical protein
MACPFDGSALLLRGECADGKQFIVDDGGFAGQTHFYRNGVLVGRSLYTDGGSDPCQCPYTRFEGTLDSVRCEGPTFEPLCDRKPPQAGYDPGFRPGLFCECDAPNLGY